MGLLDDAIREHLDLKRRRGADPTEVARMEQEALGPVRREREPAEAEADDQLGHEAAQAAAPPPEAHAEHPHSSGEGFPPEDHTHALPPSERHEGSHGDPLAEHVHPEAAPEPEPEPEPPTPITDQPTTEYRVEDHHDDEDDGDHEDGPSEDVLEETPEFLQETPEHDRLWFEQRPPRDFDFDG